MNRACFRYPAAITQIDGETILRNMKRWRANVIPPEPRSFTEFDNAINSIEWQVVRLHDKGVLEMTVANDDRGPVAIIFYDPQFVRQLGRSQSIHVLSTGRVLPMDRGTDFDRTQLLLTIVAVYKEHVSVYIYSKKNSAKNNHFDVINTNDILCPYAIEAFPCVWSWVRSRGAEAFDAALTPLMDVMQPERAYADFDVRLHDRIISKFPAVIVKGDFQSYCRVSTCPYLCLLYRNN